MRELQGDHERWAKECEALEPDEGDALAAPSSVPKRRGPEALANAGWFFFGVGAGIGVPIAVFYVVLKWL